MMLIEKQKGLIVMMELEYSSGLNGATFLLFELKQVARLKVEGYDEQEIRQKVLEENVFQFENKGRMTRILPTIMRRLDVLDQHLANEMVHSTADISKMINLYAIMKTDRFFFEFMEEVISEKIRSGIWQLEKKDLNLYFLIKEEQSEVVANWSENNKAKLKTAIKTVLYQSGLLQDRSSGELSPLILDQDLANYLKLLGDRRYVEVIGG